MPSPPWCYFSLFFSGTKFLSVPLNPLEIYIHPLAGRYPRALLHFRLILSMIVVTHTAVSTGFNNTHGMDCADPSIWAGLVTLVDYRNWCWVSITPVFIAILAESSLLPIATARGSLALMLAMVMRLLLLTSISRLVTLTQPLFSFRSFHL